MKKYRLNKTNDSIEKITWSRNYLSLLYSFGFTAQKSKHNHEYYLIGKENTNFIAVINKNEIFGFLQEMGANIKLGNHTRKIINID